jgi:hypothetical protein
MRQRVAPMVISPAPKPSATRRRGVRSSQASLRCAACRRLAPFLVIDPTPTSDPDEPDKLRLKVS